MNRKRILGTAAIGGALLVMWIAGNQVVKGQQKVQVSKFQYDPSFPQPLPENWAIGPISGIAVDSRDHIYVRRWRLGIAKADASRCQTVVIRRMYKRKKARKRSDLIA